jgi:hypothetical protein
MTTWMRHAVSLLTAGGLALLAAVPAGSAPVQQQAKSFVPGCWKGTGKGPLVGSASPAPGLKVNMDKSSFSFVLHATKHTVLGGLEVNGHGGGEAKASGVTATVELRVSGNLDLTGNPSHVVADGDLAMKGAIVVAGVTSALNQALPVNAMPLTIKTATATKVTGTAGNSTWSAVRVGKSCITP